MDIRNIASYNNAYMRAHKNGLINDDGFCGEVRIDDDLDTLFGG